MPRNKGFTLIELMIVVAIIAILAAVLTGAISSGMKKKRTTAESNFECVEGYKVNRRGNQLVDSDGHGIPCSEYEPR